MTITGSKPPNPPNSPNPRWNQRVEDVFRQFPIHIQRYEYQRGTSYHRQPGMEIHITHEGRALFLAGGRLLTQVPGQVLVHHGEEPHQLLPDPASLYRRTIICVDVDSFQGLSGRTPQTLIPFEWMKPGKLYNAQLNAKSYARLEEWIRELNREMTDRERGWETMAISYLLRLLVLLDRHVDAEVLDQEPPPELNGRLISRTVELAMDYIREHLSEPLSLEEVSGLLGVRPEVVTRCFTRDIGVSFRQYVLLQRVGEAQRLLAEIPELSIQDIALQVGFPSPSHFGRTFRKLTGISPSMYRIRSMAQK